MAVACGDDGGGGGDPDAGTSADGSVSDAAASADSSPSYDAVPNPDAAPDWDATPPDPIDVARMSPDGAVNIDIEGVLVTYEKPAYGNESIGFFIQADAMGPALFVEIDPSTLTPSPAVGDDIDLTVTEVATLNGMSRATMVSNVVVNSSGNDVTTLTQDVSATADVVSALGDYDSELITVSGTVTTAFAFGGQGHVSAMIETAGITGEANYLLRLPTVVADDLGLHDGCTFTVSDAPLWRFDAAAQVHAWDVADVTTASCNDPVVVAAVATSDTTLMVEFDRAIDDSSLTDAVNQFTFDGGLTASAASANGRFVTVTTSTQVGGTVYTVTVAASVLDLFGAGVDSMNNTAMFSGYIPPAVVRLNEIKANITGGCDLIELRVMSGGTLEGFEVLERGTSILTFGALVVATDDYVVLHFDTNDANCNPGASGNETMAVDELPVATYGANYDTAYDWYMTDDGMTATDNVLTVLDPVGTIVDAVFVSDDATGTSAAATETQAAIVAAAGEWEMVGGGIPMNGFVDDDFNAHAVQDLNAANTIQRILAVDNNDRDDWSATNLPASWGLPNVSGDMMLTYTGAEQTFDIPLGVTEIYVDVRGAQGGSATNNSCASIGGLGGESTGLMAVTPGETLSVFVGGAGQPGDVGGFNGGGTACTFTTTCARGGGASDIRQGGNTLAERIVVGGGGGGAEWSGCVGTGGIGGGLTGGTGSATSNGGAYNGTGGTQAAGGTGGDGASGFTGSDGALGVGGASGNHTNGHAGSGGGGYYGGGGGGADGHGGGGSSYTDGLVSGATNSGVQTGDGTVRIRWGEDIP
jgi:hypothetical protein